MSKLRSPCVKESVLQDICAEHFSRTGYLVREEVPLWTKFVDLYCVHPITGESVAVEVKVLNWKRAIQQANVYSFGADKVFIAVASPFVKRVEIAVLESAGVGLIAVSERDGCKVVLDPPYSYRRKQPIVDRIWTTVFKDLLFPSLLTVS